MELATNMNIYLDNTFLGQRVHYNPAEEKTVTTQFLMFSPFYVPEGSTTETNIQIVEAQILEILCIILRIAK